MLGAWQVGQGVSLSAQENPEHRSIQAQALLRGLGEIVLYREPLLKGVLFFEGRGFKAHPVKSEN